MKIGTLRNGIVVVLLVGIVTILAPSAALADSATTAAATPSTGDNAWVLISSALVLMMTAPGLALFYSGLVRKKNVLGVMMQCMFLMCLMTVIWALWGYTLSFGGDALKPPPKWLGNGSHLLMNGVQAVWENGKVGHSRLSRFGINRLTHMLFQGMFFIITPALICGAFAERMKFSTMVVFSILWGTLVYCPLCHAVWGGGILQYVSGGNPNAAAFRRRGIGLRRRNRRAYQFRRLGAGLRLGLGQTARLRQRADAAAQSDLHRHRRRHALGRLVRLQRRQRLERRRAGGQRVLRHAFRRGRRRTHLGRDGMDHPR